MKDGGEWNSKNSYDANGLPKIRVVADKAFRYLTMGKGNAKEDLSEAGRSD